MKTCCGIDCCKDCGKVTEHRAVWAIEGFVCDFGEDAIRVSAI